MKISKKEISELKKLEESLWIAKTRFDKKHMKRILAPDFFEFGRSGRVYKRKDTLAVKAEENIKATLKDFQVHPLTEDIVLITYVSEVKYDEMEIGNRSSLWIKTSNGWQIRFHQGTAVKKDQTAYAKQK